MDFLKMILNFEFLIITEKSEKIFGIIIKEKDLNTFRGFPGGSVNKESPCKAGVCLQCRKHGFKPCVRKIPQRRKQQRTPYF